MPGGCPHVWAGRCGACSGTSGGSGEVDGMSTTWSAVESSACSTGVVWTRLAGAVGAGRLRAGSGRGGGTGEGDGGRSRSEEHTSELQSIMRISYAVFCL